MNPDPDPYHGVAQSLPCRVVRWREFFTVLADSASLVPDSDHGYSFRIYSGLLDRPTVSPVIDEGRIERPCGFTICSRWELGRGVAVPGLGRAQMSEPGRRRRSIR